MSGGLVQLDSPSGVSQIRGNKFPVSVPPFPAISYYFAAEQSQQKMGRDNPAEQALVLLRTRICNPNFIFTLFSDSPDSNYRYPRYPIFQLPKGKKIFWTNQIIAFNTILFFSKLKYIVSSSVTEACNNSVLLLGPRGCGKNAVKS